MHIMNTYNALYPLIRPLCIMHYKVLSKVLPNILQMVMSIVYIYCKAGVTRHGSRCPAEFSSNPNQTHLKQLIKVLLGILETSRQVCWGKLELNSAGHRPSRIKFGDPCCKGTRTQCRCGKKWIKLNNQYSNSSLRRSLWLAKLWNSGIKMEFSQFERPLMSNFQLGN